MNTALIAVIFLFVCGVLAGLAAAVKAGQYAGAGVLAVLLIAGLLLFASAYSPDNQSAAIREEIAELKSEIETLKINTDNPAELAAVCLFGAALLVGLVFFGIYGLMIIQHKIRRSEKMMPEKQRIITAEYQEIKPLYLSEKTEYQQAQPAGGQPW